MWYIPDVWSPSSWPQLVGSSEFSKYVSVSAVCIERCCFVFDGRTKSLHVNNGGICWVLNMTSCVGTAFVIDDVGEERFQRVVERDDGLPCASTVNACARVLCAVFSRCSD